MRSYVPNTAQEQEAMLNELGLSSLDALYDDVPPELMLRAGELRIPDGMSEAEVRRVFDTLSPAAPKLPLFRGAGAYNHYIPAMVSQLAMRSEFYTAYTPYQAEMSQGMLQGTFEYQTMICELTGMDASNASVYDGATAAAEAMYMARDAKRKNKMLISAGLHPHFLATMRTYARFAKLELVELPLDDTGRTDIDALKANLDGAAGVFAASPNFYGCIEDMQAVADAAHEGGALFIACVNPISLGLLKRPGDYGADIAVGEGQPLGLPLAYGGPYLGFMAARGKLIRNLPGRIVGETADADGNRVYVLTLQAREQHIRREKASSNICSNQMLCAITASIYLAAMGPAGLREAAEQSLQKAHYLLEGLCTVKGVKLRWPNTPFFNEFTLDVPADSAVINAVLKAKGYIGGLRLSRVNPSDKGMLWCATELNTRNEIDGVICAFEEAVK